MDRLSGDPTRAKGWTVPTYWTENWPGGNPPQPGGDCISGAVFAEVATNVVGITTSAKSYMSKSEQEPRTAVEFVRQPNRIWQDANGQRVLTHLAGTPPAGDANNFEATLVFTAAPGATPAMYYMPSGILKGPVYDSPDDVLSVFGAFGWAKLNQTIGKWVLVGEPFATWTRKPPLKLYDTTPPGEP